MDSLSRRYVVNVHLITSPVFDKSGTFRKAVSSADILEGFCLELKNVG